MNFKYDYFCKQENVENKIPEPHRHGEYQCQHKELENDI